MKHRKLPVNSELPSKCKCGHPIQPGEPRIKLSGKFDKCNTCFLQGEKNEQIKCKKNS